MSNNIFGSNNLWQDGIINSIYEQYIPNYSQQVRNNFQPIEQNILSNVGNPLQRSVQSYFNSTLQQPAPTQDDSPIYSQEQIQGFENQPQQPMPKLPKLSRKQRKQVKAQQTLDDAEDAVGNEESYNTSPKEVQKDIDQAESTLDEVDTDQKKGGFGNFLKNNSALINEGIDIANDAFTSIAGEKREYSGRNGELTQSLDNAYDKVNAFVDKIPGGQLAGTLMHANKLLGSVANKLGGGTDSMTSLDAVLGSNFFGPIGWINGWAGQNANTITKNEEAFAQTGSAYGGTNNAVDDALNYSGKKYGGFSANARKDANALINEASRQQILVADIGDTATNKFDLQAGMSAILGNRRAFQLQGGYDQRAVHVGKHGMVIQNLRESKRINITRYQKGEEAEPYFKNVKRKGSDSPQPFKEGGNLTKLDQLVEVDISSLSLEFVGTDIEEVDIDDLLPEFKEGGKFNLIPEGALHARKHNMDIEGITKKGIPVVSQLEGEEIEQQAEIEREEIIFRLEVTKKLEELAKDGSDEAAIEAGKLLVEEILYNTVDNTHNLLS